MKSIGTKTGRLPDKSSRLRGRPSFYDRLSNGQASSRLARAFVLTIFLLAFAGSVAAQDSAPPAKDSRVEAQAPKKSNQRPVDSQAPASEPFDSATVEKMAGECV